LEAHKTHCMIEIPSRVIRHDTNQLPLMKDSFTKLKPSTQYHESVG